MISGFRRMIDKNSATSCKLNYRVWPAGPGHAGEPTTPWINPYKVCHCMPQFIQSPLADWPNYQALDWEVLGFKRDPGRPRTNWKSTVNKGLLRMGITWDLEGSRGGSSEQIRMASKCGPMHPLGCGLNQSLEGIDTRCIHRLLVQSIPKSYYSWATVRSEKYFLMSFAHPNFSTFCVCPMALTFNFFTNNSPISNSANALWINIR